MSAEAAARMYIAQLEADYADALRDARRYRWVRDGEMSILCWNIVSKLSGDALDAAIDSCIEDEDAFLAERRPQKVIDLGMHESDPRRGQAAGLNAQRYKPGRE